MRRLLSAREDIFDGYTEDGFVAAFAELGMRAVRREPVGDTGRTIFRFTR